MPQARPERTDAERPCIAGRECIPCLVGAFVSILLILTTAGCNAPRYPVVRTGVTKADSTPRPAGGFAWKGVGSCAATACHGGNQAGLGSRNAYTTWTARDPHAQAWATLGGDRAQQIERNLKGAAAQEAAKAESDPRCLNCHVHPDEGETPHAATFSRQDGVGCESCHGPSEQWLEPHSLPSWPGPPAGEARQRALGMRPTKDLVTRATVCAECHVGGPGRDVDHDLISAGHPRLNFELAAYLTSLPKHWNEAAERVAQSDFEVQAWAIGQVVAGRAALQVLRSRAQTAQRDQRHWPEFAEYDCFACHHDLTAPGSRKYRHADLRPPSLPWGSWYWPLLGTLTGHIGSQSLARVEGTLTAIRGQMQQRSPDPGTVAELVGRIIEPLDGWLTHEASAMMSGGQPVSALLATLATHGPTLDQPAWDHAAQFYLALRALSRNLSDRDKPPAAGTQAALQRLAEQFEFRKGYDSPDARGPLLAGPFGETFERFRSEPGLAADQRPPAP